MSLLSREEIYRMLRRTGRRAMMIADEGYTGDGGEDVLPLEDYGVGVHEEAAGHLDEAEVLLGEGEADADDKTGGETEKGDQPAFQSEGAAEHLVGGPEAAVGLDVILLLDDQHRDAAEDIQGDLENRSLVPILVSPAVCTLKHSGEYFLPCIGIV